MGTESMQKHAADYQVELDVQITLPKGWFIREWYQIWNTSNYPVFYRYPSGTCCCQLESTMTAESVIGEGPSMKEALYKAVQKAVAAR